MKTGFNDDLDLQLIADSGQCFRWERINKNEDSAIYRVIAGGRVLFTAKDRDGQLDLSCTENDFRSFWSHYLDSGTDYAKIRSSVREDDLFLRNAAETGKGIRILFQEPWECLISFIISQRKSIPAIRTCIEKLCRRAGKQLFLSAEEKSWLSDRCIPLSVGEDLFSFPTAEALLKLDPGDPALIPTGYRAPYILKAAEDVLSGRTDLNKMASLNDEDLMCSLMKLHGVGKKVASCVSLFGFHRLDFFPVDVWIEKVLDNYYRDGFPFEEYSPYNGVMQQYMFYHARSGFDL